MGGLGRRLLISAHSFKLCLLYLFEEAGVSGGSFPAESPVDLGQEAREALPAPSLRPPALSAQWDSHFDPKELNGFLFELFGGQACGTVKSPATPRNG